MPLNNAERLALIERLGQLVGDLTVLIALVAAGQSNSTTALRLQAIATEAQDAYTDFVADVQDAP